MKESFHRDAPVASPSEKPKRGKGVDWLKRAALLAGLAGSPSGGSAVHGPERGGQTRVRESEDRMHETAVRERIASYATQESSDRTRPHAGEQAMEQTDVRTTAERAAEYRIAEAETVGHNSVSVLFNPQNSAPHNFDDIGTRIRTEAQDRLQRGWSAPEVAAFVRNAAGAAYHDLAHEMDSLRTAGRGDFADELYVMFNSWEPSVEGDASQTVTMEDGTRMEIAPGRIIQLPTGTEEEEQDVSEEE